MTKFLEKSVKIAGSRFYGQDAGLRMRENNYVRYRDDTQIQFLYVIVDDGGHCEYRGLSQCNRFTCLACFKWRSEFDTVCVV